MLVFWAPGHLANMGGWDQNRLASMVLLKVVWDGFAVPGTVRPPILAGPGLAN